MIAVALITEKPSAEHNTGYSTNRPHGLESKGPLLVLSREEEPRAQLLYISIDI